MICVKDGRVWYANHILSTSFQGVLLPILNPVYVSEKSILGHINYYYFFFFCARE